MSPSKNELVSSLDHFHKRIEANNLAKEITTVSNMCHASGVSHTQAPLRQI